MRRESIAFLLAVLFLSASGIALSQDTNQNRTLIINGQSSQVAVIQVKGRPYVDLAALANAMHGSISFAGSQTALSVPLDAASTAGAVATATPASTPVPASNPGFSRAFLNAGIEQMATVREWHTALASSIRNGYPVTADSLGPYRAQAVTNLRLAAAAVSTDSDRSAYQLLNSVFQNMSKLTGKYIATRADLTYIAPDALKDDSLNQRIVSCGHSLSSMAASGQFVDDGSCD
jgi:hypothetical protein